MNLLGIDIGGTKTAVCVGTNAGEIIARNQMASRPAAELELYFSELFDMCRQTISEAGLTDHSSLKAIGISAPGPLDCRRGVLLAPPNNPGWTNIPIVNRVSEWFDGPVYMNNDANAGALAESYFGTYAGNENIIYLTNSTGMGGGFIVNGRLIQGATDMGGEIGHMVLDPNGPQCPCGMQGCWELYVGGRNVADRLRAKIAGKGISTKIIDEAGGDLAKIDHRCLAAAARAGDEFALAEWDAYINRLAQGIGILIQVFNPEVIILGTIAISEGDFLMTPLRKKIERYAWSWPREVCRIEPSSLGVAIGDLASLAVARAAMDG